MSRRPNTPKESRTAPTITPKCGTTAGATDHYRRNENPCDACRAARNDYARSVGRARGEKPSFHWSVVRRYVTGGDE